MTHPTTGRPVRSDTNRMIAGVAGGLADYARVDPLLVRVLFAVLAVFGGIGILLYAVGWLLLPARDAGRSIADVAIHKGRNGGAVAEALLLLVVVAVMASTLRHGRFSDLALLFVVVAGVVLVARHQGATRVGTEPDVFSSSQDSEPTQEPTGSSTPEPAAPQAADSPEAATSSEAAWPPGPTIPYVAPVPYSAGMDDAATAQVPEATTGGSGGWVITPLVLGLSAILLALMIGLDQPVSIRAALAIALGLTGAGILVSAFVGRARGLIAVGMLLLPALLLVSMMPLTRHGGYGAYSWSPVRAEGVQPSYQANGGSIQLDLSDVDFRHRDVSTSVSLGAGRAEIVVPSDTKVVVTGRDGLGETRLLGRVHNGQGLRIERVLPAAGSGSGGKLRLKVTVGIGEVVVRRAAA